MPLAKVHMCLRVIVPYVIWRLHQHKNHGVSVDCWQYKAQKHQAFLSGSQEAGHTLVSN